MAGQHDPTALLPTPTPASAPAATATAAAALPRSTPAQRALLAIAQVFLLKEGQPLLPPVVIADVLGLAVIAVPMLIGIRSVCRRRRALRQVCHYLDGNWRPPPGLATLLRVRRRQA